MPAGYSLTHHPQIGRINELIANGMSSRVIADAVKPHVHFSTVATYRKLLLGPARKSSDSATQATNNSEVAVQDRAKRSNIFSDSATLSAAVVTARIAQKLNRYPQLIENAIVSKDPDVAIKWDGRENTVLAMAADITGLRNTGANNLNIVVVHGEEMLKRVDTVPVKQIDRVVDIKAGDVQDLA